LSKHSRLIWIILLALAGFLLMLLVKTTTPEQQNRRPDSKVNVTTSKVETVPLTRQVDALGTALAYNSARIVNASSDYLIELNIPEGQAIKKGTLIARFNDTEERARISELKALMTEQNRQLARLKNLTRTQASAQSLLDEQQAKVNATRAQLDALEARLNELVILAPFDGVLGLRQVSNGAYLASGTELTTLDDISQVRIEFSIAERFLAALQAEMTVTADSIAYPGVVFTGQVKAIDPRIDPVTRSVKVHAVIDNADLKLRPGMLLNMHVALAKAEVLQIPEKAVMPLQSKHYVFVVGEADTVRQVEVILGQRRPGLVEVVSGLKAGDEIVTQGSQKLRTGVVISRTES
jgi:membrane fusion protein (multidrug efflux system)